MPYVKSNSPYGYNEIQQEENLAQISDYIFSRGKNTE